MQIGILALQGDFSLHARMIEKLNVETILVRKPDQLRDCDGLIIPGGESTTLRKLMIDFDLFDPIREFSINNPIFGTCAGLIVLASELINDANEKTLDLIDVTVERNAYGRQIDSFIDPIELDLGGGNREIYEGVFIRAPKIQKIGDSVKAIGFHKSDIVLAESDKILVATFHPELTDDPKIHRYFLTKVDRN